MTSIYDWITGSAPTIPDSPLTGQVCIVTGANSGIGLETVRGLAEGGAWVVMACRSLERAEEALDSLDLTIEIKKLVRVRQLDLASFKSVKQFCDQICREETKVDILINNAAIVTTARELTVDGNEVQFQVNHLGPFLLTSLLLPLLKESKAGRVVNVSSAAHMFVFSFPWSDLNQDNSWYNSMSVYSATKLANIWFTAGLKERLQDTNIKVFSLHPGGVYTNLGRNIAGKLPGPVKSLFGSINKLFLVSPADGAKTTLYCALSPDAKNGVYYDNMRPGWMSCKASDKKSVEMLWEKSLELTRQTRQT